MCYVAVDIFITFRQAYDTQYGRSWITCLGTDGYALRFPHTEGGVG